MQTDNPTEKVSGHLELFDKGFGFLRNINDNFRIGKNDVFVPAPVVRQFGLKEGVYVEGTAQKAADASKNSRLKDIHAVNFLSPAEYLKVQPLKMQTSINPEERLHMQIDPEDRMGGILDLISPIGKGQRGLIISPPKTGKTTILKHIGKAVLQNHPDTCVFFLLIDERPEEVTDFKRALPGAEVLASSADESVSNHLRLTRMSMNVAMRLAELGKDIVILIDSLTRMARAFNKATDSFNRTLTGGLGANALELPRQFFGAARNLEGGGSLTVIATILVETGSRMDDIIFQEFKGTGNMDLVLCRKCAERRIWPALNLHQSGTRKEDLLLNDKEYQKITRLRRGLASLDEVSAMMQLLDFIQPDDNE